MSGFNAEDNTFTTGTGQVIVNVHPETETCHTRGCCIHAPSYHKMVDFPTHFRVDRYLMERICEHGIGHPDPDHLAYVAETLGGDAAKWESLHGCDGCCSGHVPLSQS